jgi:tRNA (mo5U34)-methyltransferase
MSVAEDLGERIEAVGFWWHSIRLADELVTPGQKSAALLDYERDRLRIPDLKGRTVLDIGAWDGFYSFDAERRGAARVVALDHYAWSIDREAAHGQIPAVWRPDTLPGKRGFDLAHAALGSNVEAVAGDFMTMDLAPLGTFDVTLFLGVLYHLRDPLGGLMRVRSVTRGMAVIESHAAVIAGMEDRAACEFAENDEVGGDSTNWFIPNAAAIEAMCRAAGFARAELVAGPDEDLDPAPDEPAYFRAVVHAWAE